MWNLLKIKKITIFDPQWKGEYLSEMIFGKQVTEKDITCLLNSKLGKRDWYFANSGSASLYFILKSFGCQKGDEVLVPVYLCPSVFKVIDPADLNISIKSIKEKTTDKSKFVIVPSLYGNPANILEIKRQFPDLIIIDDAAQAYGANLSNQPVGTMGDAGFYAVGPGKPLFGVKGSVYWTSGQYRVSPTRSSKIITFFSYLSFIYNRVFLSKTQYFPFSVIGKFIYYSYLIIHKVFFSYSNKIDSIDVKAMHMLMVEFEQRNKENTNCIIKELRELFASSGLGVVLSPLRGSGISFKLVVLCNSPKVRRAFENALDRSSIFYSVGYQLGNRYYDKNAFPGLVSVLEKILELPLPTNSCQLELLKKAIKAI